MVTYELANTCTTVHHRRHFAGHRQYHLEERPERRVDARYANAELVEVGGEMDRG